MFDVKCVFHDEEEFNHETDTTDTYGPLLSVISDMILLVAGAT
jgi:hypothetical protein